MKDETVWIVAGLGVLWLWSRSSGPAAAVLPAVPSGTVALPVTDVPSSVSDDSNRGTTNPLGALVGWIGSVLRPQTTLPGNAPVSPGLPAGPGGAIPGHMGGNPGTAPIVLVAGTPPFYSMLYDTPGAYFDPISGTYHPH